MLRNRYLRILAAVFLLLAAGCRATTPQPRSAQIRELLRSRSTRLKASQPKQTTAPCDEAALNVEGTDAAPLADVAKIPTTRVVEPIDSQTMAQIIANAAAHTPAGVQVSPDAQVEYLAIVRLTPRAHRQANSPEANRPQSALKLLGRLSPREKVQPSPQPIRAVSHLQTSSAASDRSQQAVRVAEMLSALVIDDNPITREAHVPVPAVLASESLSEVVKEVGPARPAPEIDEIRPRQRSNRPTESTGALAASGHQAAEQLLPTAWSDPAYVNRANSVGHFEELATAGFSSLSQAQDQRPLATVTQQVETRVPHGALANRLGRLLDSIERPSGPSLSGQQPLPANLTPPPPVQLSPKGPRYEYAHPGPPRRLPPISAE